jgi:hypothetical protein
MAVTDGNGDVVGEWCTYADPESARCVWCCVNFLYKSQGISGIKKHALGSGHKKIADGRKGRIVAQPSLQVTSAADNQETEEINNNRGAASRVTQSSQSVPQARQPNNPGRTWCLNDQVDKAEILMTLKVAESNWSFRSMDNMGGILSKMDPNSLVLSKYSMKRIKCSTILSYGLFPHFKQTLVARIKSAPGYTLGTDSATFKQRGLSKHVDIVIRYDYFLIKELLVILIVQVLGSQVQVYC